MSQVHGKLELRIIAAETGAEDPGHITLAAPDVGYFAAAHPRGALLAPGMGAGVLHQLGKSFELVVPAGASGAVLSDPPSTAMAPVGYGTPHYSLDPSGTQGIADSAAGGAQAQAGEGTYVLASQSGRVWHAPAPGEPVFCATGAVLEEGQPMCLIEVMKTFSTVLYKAQNGLPKRGKVVRWLVEDGGDVESGKPLLQIEPA